MGTMARLSKLQISSGACADGVHGPRTRGWGYHRQGQGLRWTWLKGLQGRPDHTRPWHTWSSGSAPPVWVSRRRCTGSPEASHYSVELKTNMGSGSCLVPGKGADHDHGHFYCLALFRLGSRKWEAESHLGGATRDEGEGGTFPFLGLHRRLRFEERPPLMPPCPLLRGHSRSGGLLIPIGVRHSCTNTGNCSATGEELGRVGMGWHGQPERLQASLLPRSVRHQQQLSPPHTAVLGHPVSKCPSEQTLSHVQDDGHPWSYVTQNGF